LVSVLGFVLPYLFGLLPHGYSAVDNLIHLILGILGLLAYANSRLPEAERGAADPAPDAQVTPLSVLGR
jgi:hypothetical protein